MQYQIEFRLSGSQHRSPWMDLDKASKVYSSLKKKHIEITGLYRSSDGITDKQRAAENELVTEA